MNNKSKITILLVFLTTAIFAVVFLLNKPNSDSTAQHTEITEKNKAPSQGSVDHTIKANMHVHSDDDQVKVIKVTKDGVQAQSDKWETKFFNNYLDETLTRLPTLKDLEDLNNNDVHHDPEFVMEAGLRLGKIKKQVKLNRDFAPKAIEFYTNCANKKESFTPIRGLCLANLMTMKKEEGQEVDTSKYPQAVVDLAKKALEFSF